MTAKRVALFGALVFGFAAACAARGSRAQTVGERVVRIAEIEVDPHQVEAYRAALRTGIEAAIRLEPGVLTLYAVAVKGHPEQVRVVEVYASPAAYQAHLQTPHFKRYKAATQGMVRSLRLIETEPIALGSK